MVNVNVRMSEKDRDLLSSFCESIGMSISTLFNIYAKKVISEKKIPFTIGYDDSFYSENNMKWLQDSVTQMKNGKVVTKTIDELEAMTNG